MDPNETLGRLLKLASEVEEYAPGDLDGVAYEQAELIENLHGWLSTGGFLPDAWSANINR